MEQEVVKKYKPIHYHQLDEWELFDLEDDPLEQTNLMMMIL